MEFNSYYVTNETLSCGEGVGRVVFEVEKFPLSAGQYMIGLIATSDLLATSESGTHWEPRDQGLDGGLVSSLRALL